MPDPDNGLVRSWGQIRGHSIKQTLGNSWVRRVSGWKSAKHRNTVPSARQIWEASMAPQEPDWTVYSVTHGRRSYILKTDGGDNVVHQI